MDDRQQRERLGALMLERRKELRLSVRAAAQAAGIDRDTWTSAEAAKRKLSEFHFAGVEAALRWTAGSIDRILAGGDPTARTDEPTVAADHDEELDLVMSDNRLTPARKARIVELILQRREQDRLAALEQTRRLIQAFRDEGEGAG